MNDPVDESPYSIFTTVFVSSLKTQRSAASSQMHISQPTITQNNDAQAFHDDYQIKTERNNKRSMGDLFRAKPKQKKRRFRQASDLGLHL